MTITLSLIILVVASYLIGSLPTAYLLARFIYKVNIFEIGSGNMGGTNVARVMGLHWGILTAVIDACKGMMAVFLAQVLLPANHVVASMVAALSAVSGHNWSVWASGLYHRYCGRFKIIGGKGAATAFGTMMMLLPPAPIVLLLTTGIGLAVITRYASLSVLVSFAAALIWTSVWAITHGDYTIYMLYVVALAVLIAWRFRENIARLVSGTERRLGERI